MLNIRFSICLGGGLDTPNKTQQRTYKERIGVCMFVRRLLGGHESTRGGSEISLTQMGADISNRIFITRNSSWYDCPMTSLRVNNFKRKSANPNLRWENIHRSHPSRSQRSPFRHRQEGCPDTGLNKQTTGTNAGGGSKTAQKTWGLCPTGGPNNWAATKRTTNNLAGVQPDAPISKTTKTARPEPPNDAPRFSDTALTRHAPIKRARGVDTPLCTKAGKSIKLILGPTRIIGKHETPNLVQPVGI
jgi:hypothetical protein